MFEMQWKFFSCLATASFAMFPVFVSCTKETEQVTAARASKQLCWVSWGTVISPMP